MGSIMKKIKKNKSINIQMSYKFECSNCGTTKLISYEEIQSLDKKTFADNIIFKCPNCVNVRMNPITIEVDY